MQDSEFWSNLLQKPESKAAIRKENEHLITEQASILRYEYVKCKDEIDKLIIKLCDSNIEDLYKKIGHLFITQRSLRNILDCEVSKQNKNSNLNDLKDKINEILQKIDNECQINPKYIEKIEEDWEKLIENSKGVKLSKEIDWSSIPEEELGKRLRGGEIMHRDEWIPGNNKNERRKLQQNEIKSHLEFGEVIRKEGAIAFEKGDFNMALTRYTQGVQLLCWIEGINEEDEAKRTELHIKFLKNQALVALKLGKYNECIDSCNQVLKIDQHDEKARYRRAESYFMLGLFEQAKDDYRYICINEYASSFAKLAAKQGLIKLLKESKKNKNDSKKIVNRVLKQETFTENRQKLSQNTTVDSFEHPSFINNSKEVYNLNKNLRQNEQIQYNKENNFPYFDLERTKMILERLLDAYTSEDFETQLRKLRSASDYDEKRLLLRLRKILPDIQIPIFTEFGLDPNIWIYQNAKEIVDYSIGYWRTRDEEVSTLAKEVYQAIMGDILID
ncbi:TPR repeat-containing protein [Cryptosporidium serpentis]